MHSCETVPTPAPAPAPAPPPPTTGPGLLLQLGRLIVRGRSASPAPRRVTQVQSQPQEPKPAVEAQLSDRVHALWSEQIPICIEVLLAPDCPECYKSLTRVEKEAAYDKLHTQQRGLLLERWTMRAIVSRPHDSPAYINSQWLLNAVRSQLHFSQLSAWLARLQTGGGGSIERRRKLSRETCNFKKLESNCDETDSADEERKLNVVYSIKIPGGSYKMAEFSRPPTDHTFPVTDIGNNVFLKVVLESLPRIDDIPTVKCTCQKRRASKDIPINVHEDIVSKLNDLSIGSSRLINTSGCSRRLSLSSSGGSDERKGDKIVDDRMHTPCSENGKHRCSCDDESDVNQRSSTSFNQPKKLDERRLKEIAKYKRRLRKECKLKKLCDSTSSEGDSQKKEHTSIPILQAARFDRFRAIGCYRNQTYLTLPASRMECKSPFEDSVSIPPAEFKKTVSVSTQTDNSCACGSILTLSCDSCNRGMVRSEANYNLAASLNKSTKDNQDEVGTRRKYDSVDESINKKLKCDLSSNIKCDNNNIFNLVADSFSNSDALKTKNDVDVVKNKDDIIRRPKLRRLFPIVNRIDKIVHDRETKDRTEKPKESKRQKTFSISEDDYILYEKCDYGTIDRCDVDSPKDELPSFNFPETKQECGYHFEDPNTNQHENVFKFPDQKSKDNIYKFAETDDFKSQNGVIQDGKGIDNQVPSPTEVDRFRYRFDSAASMVFSTKTGLPLTSSPAPLRRGNNCFDFDDSINGISGIKSALFHPCSPPRAAVSPPSPAPPPPAPKLRVGSSTGLLGSFEESALKGRLEPVATVHGFTAELGASGAFCPPHRRLPVTVFFYAPGGTNAPYMGHINLGPSGYRVARSGTIQVSLLNPHGTLVKMFVVLYDLTCMPPMARTFLRQRTLHMPAGAEPPAPLHRHKWLRYLIHLRFMTSKSGKLYLHTDIRIIVSRKADLDTATAHSALFRPIPTNRSPVTSPPTSQSEERNPTNGKRDNSTNDGAGSSGSTNRTPNRVFGGCSEFDSENKMREIGYDNQNGVSYELRSFTYAPDNPKYSPR